MIIRDMQSTGGIAERERYTLMSGFSVKRLTEKDMKWAPAGRDHKLECMGGAQFNVVKVRDSGGPLQLAQALPQPRGSRVSISSAWVARVEEMQTKGHPDGNLLFWRDVELLSRDPRGRVPELATRASELYPYITALPHSCP